MVIDLRKRNRTIEIEFEVSGSYDIDQLIDNILPDLKIIIEQRNLPKDLKIEIILK